jgi:DnaJ-class molecular chaperone
MERRNFLAGLGALILGSCARKEQRRVRYDAHQCPVCSTEPGVCSYCHGDAKCNFCGGTGTRTTTTASMPKESINPVEYDEKCPYCQGSGTCRYCEGSSKCWVCDGSGEIKDWSFLKGPEDSES